MQVLIMDDLTRQAIARIRRHAEDSAHHNVISLVMDGEKGPPGDDHRHVVEIPQGFRAVYSVDIDGDGNLHKHLSVSLQHGMASPEAAMEISLAFGFDPDAMCFRVDAAKAVHAFGTYHVIH